MKKERIKLNLAISKLFPEKIVKIGDTSVVLQPLSLEQWISVITRFNAFIDTCADKNIDLSTLFKKDAVESEEVDNTARNKVIFKVVTLVISEFPDLLEEVTNIDKEDLQQLPPDIILELITASVEVNLESKETLAKNFNRLTSLIPSK